MNIDFITEVDCPNCYDEGPHQRKSVDLGGQFVVTHCDNCGIDWNVAGPQKWVSS